MDPDTVFGKAAASVMFACLALCPAIGSRAATTEPAGVVLPAAVGEKVPSEDDLIKDLHSLGVVRGLANIYRCACPVRDLARQVGTTQPTADLVTRAQQRMQRLRDLGVRTVISFQNPNATTGEDAKAHEEEHAVALERSAALAVGIRFVSIPISNSGEDSLQTMSDREVLELLTKVTDEILDDARFGGVAYHCSAGHDRTGIVSAFIRIKYQHWPVEEAIAEMRRLGHNWKKFSADDGESSWHEDHLRAIASLIEAGPATTRASG
jgi:hypothetical protein